MINGKFISSIFFPNCEEDDTSYYSATILEFVANGAKEQTDCWFEVRPPFFSCAKYQREICHTSDFHHSIPKTNHQVHHFCEFCYHFFAEVNASHAAISCVLFKNLDEEFQDSI